MAGRHGGTQEDVTERGRMPEPPPTWYPHGNTSSSSSQEGSSLSLGHGNSSIQTRGRGPTLRASWSKTNDKIQIETNERGQPVMLETSPLATNLGVLARDGSLLPLHYTDWRHVPVHYKLRVWEEIKDHTNADDSMQLWFMQSLGKKWQGWKHEAKKQGYVPYEYDADRLANKPNRVTEHQWRCLVYYWNDQDVKEKSRKNKGSRSKQTLLSTTGRTPHYVIEHKDKKSGKNPTRIETFIKTHATKDGKTINKETEAIFEKLKELQCQKGSSSRDMSEDAILTQVIGPERPGRLRGLGLGATQSMLRNLRTNNQGSYQSSTQRDDEFMKMKSKMEKMKRFLQAMGYSDDSDDDLEKCLPALDVSNAHRQMASDSNQASVNERDPSSPQLKRTLLPQFAEADTPPNNRNITTSKVNDGESRMRLRSSRCASNSGHAESLVATLGKRQHLAIVQITGFHTKKRRTMKKLSKVLQD